MNLTKVYSEYQFDALLEMMERVVNIGQINDWRLYLDAEFDGGFEYGLYFSWGVSIRSEICVQSQK